MHSAAISQSSVCYQCMKHIWMPILVSFHTGKYFKKVFFYTQMFMFSGFFFSMWKKKQNLFHVRTYLTALILKHPLKQLSWWFLWWWVGQVLLQQSNCKPRHVQLYALHDCCCFYTENCSSLMQVEPYGWIIQSHAHLSKCQYSCAVFKRLTAKLESDHLGYFWKTKVFSSSKSAASCAGMHLYINNSKNWLLSLWGHFKVFLILILASCF